MPHSAHIWTDHREFEREFGAVLRFTHYEKFFRERIERGTWRKIPKGLKDAFANPRDEDERKLREIVGEGDAGEVRALELELFRLRTRIDHAERMLQKKTTEQIRAQALGDRHNATGKLEAVQQRLDDLRRSEALEGDSRVHPGQYAPVMIVEDGRRTVIPMRYHCRLPGWTAIVERRYPDTCHARREDLGKRWSKLFGRRHGIMVVTSFREDVPKRREGRNESVPAEIPETVPLDFAPHPPRALLVPCLWNYSLRSTPEERDIFSFAAITAEAPPGVAAAGHDRCLVSIKPEHLDAWLDPEPQDPQALHAILDDRDRPHFASSQT
ncbi:MAG: SOS response-associated peptidase family protein [Proteobacteria bacterium]|nr:SOS response-associated peptidase family protein [Pseudomonadota bacterium]